ncbi:MAG: hypothetical protein ABEJ28_10085 [Salinigranum sp.]
MSDVQSTVARTSGSRIGPAAIGGAVLAVLALLHLFVVQLGGAIGVSLLLVGWPLVGGGVAAALPSREARPPRMSGLLAGAYAGFVVGLVVLLSGWAGLWSPFVATTFGVEFWPVVFAAWLVFLVSWAVFGFVAGYAVERFGTSSSPTAA